MNSILPDNKRLCGCGCGQEVSGWNRKTHQPYRFKRGHYARLQIGPLSPFWKGGKYTNEAGYVMVSGHWDHPRNRTGQVREHILVYEKSHNCCLLRWSAVHHINHDRADNRPENLQGMMIRQHVRLHLIDMSQRYCSECGSSKTSVHKRNNICRPRWFRNKSGNGFLCNNCRSRLRYHKQTA